MASTQAAFVRRLRKVYGVRVRTRKDWGSTRGSVYAWRLINKRATVPADTVVEHITVTFDDGKLTGNFDADMRELERIGYARFGSGISYNFAIDHLTGMVGIGQPLRAKGTHTVNNKNMPGYSHDQNKVARAIAWIGVPGNKISDECREAHVKLLACLMDCGHVTPDPDYKPHSFFAAKECPTEAMRKLMPLILSDARKLHQRKKNIKTPWR